MAGRGLIETSLADASRDFISPLPEELKHRILECLPTRDAASTALLSTHWNHVWLQHERLEFSDSVQQGHDDGGKTLVDIINNILLSCAGPVKKFSLVIEKYYPELRQSDFNRWCVFLSRNGVEELFICFLNCGEAEYKLPFCILSCRTIKYLRVDGTFIIDLPVNSVGGIFSNITSLSLGGVEFRCTVSISIPNLEKLVLEDCGGINKFEIISSSKLERLCVYNCVHDGVESRWLAPHLKAIKTLWLCGSSLLVS